MVEMGLKLPGTVLLCVDGHLLDLDASQVLAVALVGLVVVLQLADPGAVDQHSLHLEHFLGFFMSQVHL